MRGFKSFGPKRTSIKFDKGFTVVTGPNGSEKSNILDAIRFVLGDISARSLRADRMAKVIFDGSPDVKASSSSSVSIQFDNSDRKIPFDTNTVTVSRTVNKSGASKYRIDGKIISRNKFIDILNVAGISFSGHNIVVQGTITKLADITPEERRKVIEDLIGIAEYNLKKNQAQTQLRQADINLRVASARINEVQNRVESLEKERNDALRYNYIQNEIVKLRSIIISRNIIKLEKEITQLTNIVR